MLAIILTILFFDGKAHMRVRSCNITEYFGVHYSTVNRVMKGIEQKGEK